MTTLPSSIHRDIDDSLQDADALARFAQSKDPKAFATIAHRYQQMVLATCRRVLHSQADAEDAAQETLMKLARSAGMIRGNAAAGQHGALNDGFASPEQRTWRELEPALDEALAKLGEAERNAIVGHFLWGGRRRIWPVMRTFGGHHVAQDRERAGVPSSRPWRGGLGDRGNQRPRGCCWSRGFDGDWVGCCGPDGRGSAREVDGALGDDRRHVRSQAA